MAGEGEEDFVEHSGLGLVRFGDDGLELEAGY